MQKFVSGLVGLALLGYGIGHAVNAAETKTTGKKATAKELLAAANKAEAAMIKAARADKDLDPSKPKNKPFYAAVKKLSQELDRAEKGLASKSNDFFDAISDARAAEAQMKVDWHLTDSKNKKVIDNAKKLGHALAVLRTDFSKEAARKKQGGELTPKEKAEFEKIKSQQKDLLAKLEKLEGKAKNDKGLLEGLNKMKKEARRIVDAPATMSAFVATLYTVDEIEGQLSGYDYYVDKEWRSDWITVDTYVASWEATYDEFLTSESYEWASAETAVDIEVGEEIEVSESLSESEIESQESYVENASFDLTDAEEEQVAQEEESDEDVSDDDDASMEDSSDDEGEDFDGDGDDDGGADSGDEGGDEGD